jgi:hypothetical protein
MEYLAWFVIILAGGIGLAFVIGGACRLGVTDRDNN